MFGYRNFTLYCSLDAVDSKQDKTDLDEPDFHQRTSGKEYYHKEVLVFHIYSYMLSQTYKIVFFVEVQTSIQQTSPTNTGSPISVAVLESSIVSPQTSSLLLSSSRKSDNEGWLYILLLYVLLKYFLDLSPNTETDSLSKKKSPIMEDELSSLNIKEGNVGSPKKKLKYDDTGGH